MKKLMSILLSICMLLSITAGLSFTAHAETLSGLIPIEDKYDLYAMRDNPRGSYYLTDDIVFTENDYKYGGDFFNDGEYYKPMDNFSGTFDGCGHTVSGLKGDSLIAYTNNGTIKNVCLNDCELTSGAICKTNNDTVTNCKIKNTTANGVVYQNCNELSYCFSEGSNCGVCGYNSGKVSYCINYSDITDWYYKGYSSTYAGGIVSYNNGAISCCGNYGSVDTYANDIGGICGYGYNSSVERCYNYGTIGKSRNNGSGIVEYSEKTKVCECINYGEAKTYGISYYTDTINCVNLGTVNNGNGYALTGSSSSIDSYYLKGSGKDSTGAVELTEAQIKQKSSFPQLNLEDTWQMTEDGIKLQIETTKTSGLMMYSYPDKLTYNEGESFDDTGMLVMSYDNKGDWKFVNDYSVEGFTGKCGLNKVTIKSEGLSASFDVTVKQDINKSKITQKQNTVTTNGRAYEPVVTVISPDGKKLLYNTDYTVKYSNNINPGKAVISVTGKGDYKGTANKYFIILPMKVSSVKASSALTSISLSWKKQSGIDGYSVEKYNPSTNKYAIYCNTKNNSVKVSELSPGTKYYFRVRSYKNIDSKPYYGAYSDTLSATADKLVKVGGLKVASRAQTSVNLSWTKQNNAEGYCVEKYNPGTKKYSPYCYVKSNTAKVSGLAVASQYYFRVCSYKKVDGVTFYGPYSNTLTAVTQLPNVKGVKIKWKESGKWQKTTIKWKKAKGISGYQLNLGCYEQGSILFHTTVTVSKNKKKYLYKRNWKKYNKLETTAVKIRTYKVIGGKTYYGAWSKTKKAY